MHDDSPFYGYNVACDNRISTWGAEPVGVVDFLLPHVKPGLSVLDAGCGARDDNAGACGNRSAGQGDWLRPGAGHGGAGD